MGSFKAQDWNSSKEKNFKATPKKKYNSLTDFSQFDDELDNYPQLNRYKKQDYRLSKRKDLRNDFDQA